jgi:hypothetical protein
LRLPNDAITIQNARKPEKLHRLSASDDLLAGGARTDAVRVVVLLVLFILAGILAVRRFHPALVASA